MKITYWLLIPAAAFSLSSCDPGLAGDLKVFNHSDSTIVVTVKTYKDSSTIVIPPDSNAIVGTIGGLGDKSDFTCCPCEVGKIFISTPAGIMKKDASKSEHWIIPNKNKLKRFGSEAIRCELHIVPSDI